MEIKIDKQVRGTRILTGDLANKRRNIINNFIDIVKSVDFNEIVLPSIENSEIYVDKAGPEILNQMYIFPDRKERQLCLRPEGTATCQLIANEIWKYEKDIKLWYEVRCWRYERPQAGRYREFTQFGVEILNPTQDYRQFLILLAAKMINSITDNYQVLDSVKRGLAYYTEDGFEIICPELGAQKQVCGGGSYKEGIGFAFGIDRLMLL